MALATESDVEAALGRDLQSTEDVSTLLETASDRVNAYLGWDVPDPVPGPVIRVVAEMVAAVLLKPAITSAMYDAGSGIGSGTGGYNQTREATSVRVGVDPGTSIGPWMTGEQKKRLGPYRATGLVRMVSDRTAT